VESRSLPPRPNLQQYKKQAKELLKACSSGHPDDIHLWAERWFETNAEQTHREQMDHIEKRVRASKLLKPDPTLADAQFFVAREHGFENWPKFVKQIQALHREDSLEATFEAAASAIASGDIQTLRRLLRTQPELIHARSQRLHNSTLLHYVAANGIEDFRQKTPSNIVEITNLLLAAGAEVDAESNAYGGGCTALGLVATSVHPERAGVQEALLQILLDHGALIDKPGAAGNRQTAVQGCLANGRGQAARFLASHGARLTLETAAGTGQLAIVKAFFQEDGALKSTATREELQRGFLWACMYGYHQVVRFLLDHGADLRDQANTGATGLHWAAAGAHLTSVQLSIQRGAPLEEINQWGGTVLEQAGWGFANDDSDRDYVPVFEALLAAGAKVQDGWLAWLERQSAPPALSKARIAELLRRYGAVA